MKVSTTATKSDTVAAESNPSISVSRAGSILQPSAAAEANSFDTTAVRAATNTTIKDSSGLCLTIDRTTGDFRENLIPVTLLTCDGSRGQQWDFITSGKHNNVPGQALIVSSLTNGCLNFDPRRAVGDQVIIFSCGGRADGGGIVTDSQLFPFKVSQSKLAMSPTSTKGTICLVNSSGRLAQASCNGAAEQLFTVDLDTQPSA